MNKIVIQDYHYSCSDGCCDEYGSNLYVNGKEVGTYSEIDENMLEDVLREFGIEAEVKHEYDYED